MLSTMNNNIQEPAEQHSRFQSISSASTDELDQSSHQYEISQPRAHETNNFQTAQEQQKALPPIFNADPTPKLTINAPIPLQKLGSLAPFKITEASPKEQEDGAVFKPRIPIEDVLALREFLRQVDLRHYGFRKEGEDHPARNLTPISPKTGVSSSILLNSPRNNESLRFRSVHRNDSEIYSSGHDDEDIYNNGDFEKGASMIRHHSFSSGISIVPSSPLRPISRAISPRASAHVPYKGKFGPNPKCASCQTTKTPYWRDAWNQGILLCNACGLRFAKFKRRCTQCHYVPRKEDKSNRCCPSCRGQWTQ